MHPRPDLESKLVGFCRDAMTDVAIGSPVEIPPSADLFYALELYIPGLLRERYPEWKDESLDGFFPAEARRTDATSLRIAGICILITDQRVTPFLVELSISDETVERASIRLGEPGAGPLGISGPTCGSTGAERLLNGLLLRIDSVKWSFRLDRARPE